jgi:hypothetical protein
MLRRALHDVTAMRIHAMDGDVGHVHDLYIDSRQWTVRYLEVEIAPWPYGRDPVLLAPDDVQTVDSTCGKIDVALSRAQVRGSPTRDTHKPVSRQHRPGPLYLEWPFVWPEGGWDGAETAAQLHQLMIEARHEQLCTASQRPVEDAYLWSARTMAGYSVEGAEGRVGHVEDFVVDPGPWAIRYVLIGTRSWLSGRWSLVPTDAIEDISWESKTMRLARRGETP